MPKLLHNGQGISQECRMKTTIRIIAGCILLQTADCITVAADDPLENWTWRNPLPQGSLLLGVAYGNGLFVAVGKFDVAVSPDGLNWQTSSFSGPANSDFSGIDFVSGVFLGRTTAGTKLSENGSEWTLRPWIHYYGSRRIVQSRGTLFSVGFGGGVLQSAPLSAGPQCNSPRMGPDGSYQFTITGQFPQDIRIEISPDLSNWQPLITL